MYSPVLTRTFEYLRALSTVLLRIYTVDQYIYRMYKKKLNRFEIALNYAKHLFVSGFLYI